MLGPYLGNPAFGDILPTLAVWRPRIALVTDPGVGAARELKSRMHPQGKLVARVSLPDGQLESEIRDDFDAAVTHALSLFRQFAEGNSEVDWWFITNEMLNNSAANLDLLGRFSVALAERMAPLKLAAGGFSSGTPPTPTEDPACWGAWIPHWRRIIQLGGILNLHEYGTPDNPETGTLFDDAPWHIGRYHQLVRPHLPADLQNALYFLGETGCDMRHDRTGWKTGFAGNVSRYSSQCVELANRMATWRGCLGGVVFLWKEMGGWGDFDIDGTPAAAFATAAWPAPAAPPPPPPAELKWAKIAWAMEQTARILKGEGMTREHDYILASTFYRDVIRERDS